MAKNNLVVWLIVGVIAALALGLVPLNNLDLGGDNVDDDTSNLPSDLTATVTLNTFEGDLAASQTDVDVSYYVFTSDGKYEKSGTTSSGQASFNVNSDAEYKVIAYEDDDSGSDYLPSEVSFNTKGTNAASVTVNVGLDKESAASISSLKNPIDLDSNVTITAGSQADFEVLIASATARAAVRNPMIVVDVNKSEIQDVTFSSLTEETCPDRLSITSGRKLYCFAVGKTITSEMSASERSYSGILLADDSVTPASGNVVNVTVIDEGIYLEPSYKSVGYSAVKYGAENPITNADVGASDSAASTLTFD